jgi:transcriptional regulator with XRE-family HTH domain
MACAPSNQVAAKSHKASLVAEHPERPLHRIRTVRHQQGVSLRTAARRLNMGVDQVRAQEDEAADMTLSTLHRWQQLLEVPISDLLVDLDDPLSEPILMRAQLVRLMKTAASLQGKIKTVSGKRLAQTLVDQLIEIMPELEEVSPWHEVGPRRTRDEVGRIAEEPLPDSLFPDATWRDAD